MHLDTPTLKRLARDIATTNPDEICCAECFLQVDEYIDLVLAGKSASQALPLVQNHLEQCGNCREEFEALLAAVRGLA